MIDIDSVIGLLSDAESVLSQECPGESMRDLRAAIAALQARAEREIRAHNARVSCARCRAADATHLFEPGEECGIEVCEPCHEALELAEWERRHPARAERLAALEGGYADAWSGLAP